MKFRITLKDPDGVYESCDDAAVECATALRATDMGEDEYEDLVDSSRHKIKKIIEHWFEFGEYLTVEIDTEEMTCVVVPR